MGKEVGKAHAERQEAAREGEEKEVSDFETTPEKEGVIKTETRGGHRPGAGQPPNAVKYKRQIAKATDIMGKMLPEAADAVVDLATGAYVLLVFNPRTKEWEKPRTDKVAAAALNSPGMYRVYREPPDLKAIVVMFERLMGKVVQPVDVTVREAITNVTESQAILMRVIEEHVPGEYLAPVREELERVAELHSQARTAVGLL